MSNDHLNRLLLDPDLKTLYFRLGPLQRRVFAAALDCMPGLTQYESLLRECLGMNAAECTKTLKAWNID